MFRSPKRLSKLEVPRGATRHYWPAGFESGSSSKAGIAALDSSDPDCLASDTPQLLRQGLSH